MSRNIRLESLLLSDTVRNAIKSGKITRSDARVTHHRSDVWICFNSYLKRKKFMEDLVRFDDKTKPTTFKNQAEDSKHFPFGVDVPFAWSGPLA
jgi:hypothetical protein